MEINNPDLSRLSETTDEILSPSLFNEDSEEYKLVMAIGVGFTVPWVSVNSRQCTFNETKERIIIDKYFIFNN